ncbi:unnamed protein product [Owenia fusiformis]|uniref:Ubiquitin carboxyl-terminal hydrolase n=1 Tax=Owenia fusiformis TaxID=6347 RepID=A0A8J1XN59_OWEFU|nr:unnamed protein product [Owenia fusiformis]
MDCNTLKVLGGVAAAVVAGVYVLWGPGDSRRTPRRKDTCPGLTNLGNTCFLNAVLQALAPCKSIMHWLGDFVEQHIHQNYSDFLAYTLVKVLKDLNNEGTALTDDVTPYEVTDALRSRRWVISQDEQDAHELFHVLTESLDEETSRFPAVLSLLEVLDLQKGQYLNHTDFKSKINSELPSLPERQSNNLPFRGLLACQLSCKLCGYKNPVKHDTFDSLSLSLPDHTLGVLTLDRLLRDYITSETVQSVSCEGCAKIQQAINKSPPGSPAPKTTFAKRMTISKLPRSLCLHIQRTVWLNNGSNMKKFDIVKFPEILIMDNYVYHKQALRPQEVSSRLVGGQEVKQDLVVPSTPKKQRQVPSSYLRPSLTDPPLTRGPLRPKELDIPSQSSHNLTNGNQINSYPGNSNHSDMYKLVSVVVHLGGVESGHFITYRRAPGEYSHKWLYTSDSMVKRVTLQEVMESEAYMLFYEKI